MREMQENHVQCEFSGFQDSVDLEYVFLIAFCVFDFEMNKCDE